MTLMREFPLQYVLLREYVDTIYAPSSILEEFGNEDVFVHLKDGRALGFTVFALVNIQQLMNQDALDVFVSPGMLIVISVTWEAIFSAIEETFACGLIVFSSSNKSKVTGYSPL